MPRSTFYYQLKHLNDEDKHAEEKEIILFTFDFISLSILSIR